MPRTIQDEQTDFDKQIPDLLKDHRGQFVLFQDGRPVEFFPTNDAAYAAGVARFGPRGTFLVAPVLPESPVPVSMAWDYGVMFGTTG